MKAEESIRINLAIHPEKDPALFKLLNSISKEARTRRIVNLAYAGLLAESGNVPYISSNFVSAPNDMKSDGDMLDISSAPSSNGKESVIEIGDDEHNALGEIFGS